MLPIYMAEDYLVNLEYTWSVISDVSQNLHGSLRKSKDYYYGKHKTEDIKFYKKKFIHIYEIKIS